MYGEEESRFISYNAVIYLTTAVIYYCDKEIGRMKTVTRISTNKKGVRFTPVKLFALFCSLLSVLICVSCAPGGKQGTGNQEPGKEGETGKGVALGNWEREGYGFVKEGLSVSGNVSSFRTVFLTGTGSTIP